MWDPSSKKVIHARDVGFDETNLISTTTRDDSDWPKYAVRWVNSIGDEGGEVSESHRQEQYLAVASDFDDFDASLERTPENTENG